MPNQIKSPVFRCTKYFLAAFALVQLFSSVLIWFDITEYAKSVSDPDIGPTVSPTSDYHYQYDKNQIRAAVILMLIVTDIFLVIGFVGAIREHYCLSMAYAVFLTFETMGLMVMTIANFGHVLQLIVSGSIMFLSFWFCKQIRINHFMEQYNDAPMPSQVIIGPANPVILKNPDAKAKEAFSGMPDPPPSYFATSAQTNQAK